MIRLAERWGLSRVIGGIIVGLFLSANVQAAVLNAIRLGISANKTRLVFELDQALAYQVSITDTSVQVLFESLSVPEPVTEDIQKSRGGLLRNISQFEEGGKTLFRLKTDKPFHLRYFDLAKPDRVVMDLYPKEAAKATATAATAPTTKKSPEKKKAVEPAPAKPQPVAKQEAALDTSTREEVALRDTAASKPQPATASMNEPGPEETQDLGTVQVAKRGNPTWLYFAVPAVVLILLGIVLSILRKASRVPKPFEEESSEISDLSPDTEVAEDSGEVDDSSELNEPAPERPEPAEENIPPTEEPGVLPEPETEEVAVSPELDSDEKFDYVTEKPASAIHHEIGGDIPPELSFEEGRLVWPVKILDGERPGRIMIVDDEETIVKSLCEYLEGEEYHVLGVTDGDSAEQKFQEWRPDLVIMDVVMPGLSGVNLVEKIRATDEFAKVIFLSGRTERDSVSLTFARELQEGLYEFLRKPVSLLQIGGRIKDYFSNAREILRLNLLDREEFGTGIQHLNPNQMANLQRYLWDRIFEISANMLGRRIEPYFITDRMEPAVNYMRRVGCQEREDYCIANICFVSNPQCAANKLRAEAEVMRLIITELRNEYLNRVSRHVGQEDLAPPTKKRKKGHRKAKTEEAAEDEAAAPPDRKLLRRLVEDRSR